MRCLDEIHIFLLPVRFGLPLDPAKTARMAGNKEIREPLYNAEDVDRLHQLLREYLAPSDVSTVTLFSRNPICHKKGRRGGPSCLRSLYTNKNDITGSMERVELC